MSSAYANTIDSAMDTVKMDIPGRESKSALLTNAELQIRYPLVPDWVIEAITTRYGTGHFQNRFGLRFRDTERVKALLLMLDAEISDCGDHVNYKIEGEYCTILNTYGHWLHLPRFNHMLEERGHTNG